MEFDFLRKHYPDKSITLGTDEYGCAFAEIETEGEPVTVWYEERDSQPYMVCFSFQHIHCFDKEDALEWTESFLSGEKSAIEFFIGDRPGFGGDIDSVRPENFTAEYLKSTWINDYLFSRAIPENLICKVRSVKKEFCFDASIGTDGSVTVYNRSGETL